LPAELEKRIAKIAAQLMELGVWKVLSFHREIILKQNSLLKILQMGPMCVLRKTNLS